MDTLELSAQRANTDWFIKADPVDIQLIRTVATRTPSGGSVRQPAIPQPSLQQFRLIPRNDATETTMTLDGTVAQIQFVLMGRWDCDMAQWDTFSFDDVEFEIAGPITPMHTIGAYERKGAVVRRAKR